jgi:hypothetical protein
MNWTSARIYSFACGISSQRNHLPRAKTAYHAHGVSELLYMPSFPVHPKHGNRGGERKARMSASIAARRSKLHVYSTSTGTR